jgi:hypothetical protein
MSFDRGLSVLKSPATLRPLGWLGRVRQQQSQRRKALVAFPQKQPTDDVSSFLIACSTGFTWLGGARINGNGPVILKIANFARMLFFNSSFVVAACLKFEVVCSRRPVAGMTEAWNPPARAAHVLPSLPSLPVASITYTFRAGGACTANAP